MEIVNVEQRSPEWFKLKEKRMSASHATAISANGKGLETYVNQLMYEYYSTGEPKSYKGPAMERGNELEDSAAFMYAMETGYEVEKIGFVIHSDYAGCSPDAFCHSKIPSEKGMAEIKCREDKEYFRLLRGGKLDTGDIWQMQMQLLICRRDWCDFVAYNPNYKKELIITRVLPDPNAADKIRMGLISGQKMIEEIENDMKSILGG